MTLLASALLGQGAGGTGPGSGVSAIGALAFLPAHLPVIHAINGEVWLRSGYGIDETDFINAYGASSLVPLSIFDCTLDGTTAVTNASGSINSLAVTPQAMIATSSTGRIGRTTDGSSWTNTTIGSQVRSVASNGVDRFVSIDAVGDVRVSTDHGVSWVPATTQPVPTPTTGFNFDPVWRGIVFYAGKFRALFASHDSVSMYEIIVYTSVDGHSWVLEGSANRHQYSGGIPYQIRECPVGIIVSNWQSSSKRLLRDTLNDGVINSETTLGDVTNSFIISPRAITWGRFLVTGVMSGGSITSNSMFSYLNIDGSLADTTFSTGPSNTVPIWSEGETLLAAGNTSNNLYIYLDRFSAAKVKSITGLSYGSCEVVAKFGTKLFIRSNSAATTLLRLNLLKRYGICREVADSSAALYIKIANSEISNLQTKRLSDVRVNPKSGLARTSRLSGSINSTTHNIGPLYPDETNLSQLGHTSSTAGVSLYPTTLRGSGVAVTWEVNENA